METDHGLLRFPVLNMKVYDTFCEMQGVRPEQAINPVSALEVLEGQVALVHHIMAFEEANPAVHILSPRQKWKAGFSGLFPWGPFRRASWRS